MDTTAPTDSYARWFENARGGLLLLKRASGCVAEVNTAFLRMAARKRDEVVGRNFWEPPLIADREAGVEVGRFLQTGGIVEGAWLPLQSGDGRQLLMEISGSATGDVIQVEIQDATAREQARQAQQTETLCRLAARTAGEFQYLDRTLQTIAELLLLNAGRDRPVLRVLDEVQQAGERAGSIASHLLAFCGQTEFQLRRFELNGLLEGILPGLRQLFGREIEIVYEPAPDLEPVIADPAQIRQMFLKLAANAAEAMGNKGTFRVRTCNGEGPFAMIAVSDSGPGLDEESWAHLFEPFSSSAPNRRGLGLAAVYGIVRQSRGRIWVYSQPNQGTQFRIHLPLARAYFPSLPDPPVYHTRPGALLLLVESNDALRALVVNLLKRRGYRVLAALDWPEALRVMESHGAPDLLISQSEPDLARHLLDIQPRFPVLYLADQASGARAQGLAPWLSVLRKPFEPEALLGSIRKLLERPL